MTNLHDLPLAFDRPTVLALGFTRHEFYRLSASPHCESVAPGIHTESVRWHLADRVSRHLAPPKVSITVDKSRHVSDDSPWFELMRSPLPDSHIERLRDVPVTGRARTALDCMRSLPLGDAVAVADVVVARGVTPGELVDMRKFESRWPGVRAARRGIGLVDGRRESWLESASAVSLDGWGLPEPFPQVDILDEAGAFLGRCDTFYRELSVVGEADGAAKYRGEFGGGTGAADVANRLIAADRRARGFGEAGLGVVRWDRGDLADPERIVRRIRNAARTDAPRAVFRCSCCGAELRDCSCAPRLCLPRSAKAA